MRMTWLFGHGNAPRAPVIVALLVLLNALILRAADPDALVRLRDLAFDGYQRIKPRVVPDDLPVYPTHGAGSFCSSGAGGDRTTTIGRERATNPFLAARDEDDFVRLLLDAFGTYPPYFLRLREKNRRGPRVYGRLPDLAQIELEAFDRARAQGAELIDVRDIEAYAADHIPGSLSIALRPVFARNLYGDAGQ